MFVQFLHDQLLKLASGANASGSARQVDAARAGLYWATLLTRDPLFLPTVDLAQSPVAEALASDLALLAREDFVQFIGSSVDVDEIYRSKRTHFNRTSLLAPWEDREARSRLQRFESSLEARRINTTTDLKMRWMRNVGHFLLSGDSTQDTPLSRQIRQVELMLDRPTGDKRFADALGLIPKRLEHHAFLWQVVEDLRIFPFRTAGQPRRQLEIGLAWEWIVSHLDEYRTTLLVGLAGIGPMDFGVSETHPSSVIHLSKYREAMNLLGLREALASLTLSEIVALRHDPKILRFRDGFLADLYRTLLSRLPESDPQIYSLCERIRSNALDQRAPLKAIAIAAEISRYHDEPARQSTSRAPVVTIGVMVALAEELEALKILAEEDLGPVTAEHDSESGRTIYRVRRYRTGAGKDIDLFFALVGKGQEDAAAATALILSEHRVDIVVNIGIAGALNDDVTLSDVVVGTEVVSYLANSKAEGGADGEFEIKMAGKTASCDLYLVERIEELRFTEGAKLQRLTDELKARAQGSVSDGELLGELKFNVVSGPIASGPVVAAAPGFKKWILNTRRDLLAVEMEASGVGIAVGRAGMVRHIRFLALRGISDLADDKKKELEGSTKGAVRRLATIAPMAVLLAMLDELPREALITAT